MGSGIVSPGHIIIVVMIALLVFGPKRLPELGRSLGSGMRGFKEAITGDDGDDDEAQSRPAIASTAQPPTKGPADSAPTDAAKPPAATATTE